MFWVAWALKSIAGSILGNALQSGLRKLQWVGGSTRRWRTPTTGLQTGMGLKF